MLDLVKRWSKLEPKRCLWRDDSYQEYWIALYQNDWEEVARVGDVDLPYLQAAVQEACRERGWFYTVQRWTREGKEVYACVGWKASEPGKANAQSANEWGSEEAVTLLTAYLRALEAQ